VSYYEQLLKSPTSKRCFIAVQPHTSVTLTKEVHALRVKGQPNITGFRK